MAGFDPFLRVRGPPGAEDAPTPPPTIPWRSYTTTRPATAADIYRSVRAGILGRPQFQNMDTGEYLEPSYQTEQLREPDPGPSFADSGGPMGMVSRMIMGVQPAATGQPQRMPQNVVDTTRSMLGAGPARPAPLSPPQATPPAREEVPLEPLAPRQGAPAEQSMPADAQANVRGYLAELRAGRETQATAAPPAHASQTPRPAAPERDNEIQNARMLGGLQRLGANLTRGSRQTTADLVNAMTGGRMRMAGPDDAAYQADLEAADRPEQSVLQRRTAEIQQRQAQRAAAMNDPTSAESRQAQEMVRRSFPGFAKQLGASLEMLPASKADSTAKLAEFVLEQERKGAADAETARHNAASERTAMVAAQNAGQSRAAGMEAGLRKELLANPATKTAQDVAGVYSQAMGAPPTGAGDMTLLYSFLKILDPGSAVREGEFANAGRAGGLPGQVQGYFNKLTGDGTLPDSVRREVKAEADRAYRARMSSFGSVQDAYRGLAQGAGVDPTRVAIPLGLEPQAAPAATPPSSPERKSVNGKIYEKRPDGWYEVE